MPLQGTRDFADADRGFEELRNGSFGTPLAAASHDIMAALAVELILDSVAVRVESRACSWPSRSMPR